MKMRSIYVQVQVSTFIWKGDKRDNMGPILLYMMRRIIFDCDRSEMARRSTWRTEELRLFPMERRGNLYSRLTRIMLTMVLIKNIRISEEYPTMTKCSIPGHPPWQCDNVFQDTHLEDAGEISVKTNKDSSSCQLKVACEFKYVEETFMDYF